MRPLAAPGNPAQYLLRIDDLTPGMDAPLWPRLCALLRRHRLQPILAIVPDNQDASLGTRPPDPRFWPEMLALQSSGASIGLHGYRHLCHARGFGLVPLHRRSEFVGVPAATQSQWIAAGVQILRGHNLDPTLWVAPRHGSDRATLRALHRHGISLISDGFASRPYRRFGCTWIPQQLWQPVEKARGLWTICLHPATLTAAALERLEAFVAAHAAQFSSIPRVLEEWHIPEQPLSDRLAANCAYFRHFLRRLPRSSSSQ